MDLEDLQGLRVLGRRGGLGSIVVIVMVASVVHWAS
jgi:hypothetical protein